MGTSRVISGPKEGAGELGGNYHTPGAAAMRTKGRVASESDNSASASGKAPKGMKIEREGE